MVTLATLKANFIRSFFNVYYPLEIISATRGRYISVGSKLSHGLYLEAYRMEKSLACVQGLDFMACRTEKSLARV